MENHLVGEEGFVEVEVLVTDVVDNRVSTIHTCTPSVSQLIADSILVSSLIEKLTVAYINEKACISP